MQDEFLQRTSHALAVDGGVWLVDPVDEPELADRVRALGPPAGVLQLLDRHERGCAAWAGRFGIPVLRAWEGVGGAPFEPVPILRRRWWREAALWEPRTRTLVCAEALGTISLFLARDDERLGVHPGLRPFPPRRQLGALEPERILVGHGAGVDADAAEALRSALATARRRMPSAWLRAARASRR